MDVLLNMGKWLFENMGPLIAALNMVILGLIALFALIPGDQPEKFLQSVVDFISKFSRKPKE